LKYSVLYWKYFPNKLTFY